MCIHLCEQQARPVKTGGAPRPQPPLATAAGTANGSLDQREVLKRPRAGNELACVKLIAQYYAAMIHIAVRYVSSHATAEDVIQQTALGVLQGCSASRDAPR
jgi:hypothetical protein